MKKCKVCETKIVSKVYKLYCSSKCAKYGNSGVLLPDPKKKFKHLLPATTSDRWNYRCYN